MSDQRVSEAAIEAGDRALCEKYGYDADEFKGEWKDDAALVLTAALSQGVDNRPIVALNQVRYALDWCKKLEADHGYDLHDIEQHLVHALADLEALGLLPDPVASQSRGHD